MVLTFDCHGQRITLTTLTPGSYGAAPSPKGRGGGPHILLTQGAALQSWKFRRLGVTYHVFTRIIDV